MRSQVRFLMEAAAAFQGLSNRREIVEVMLRRIREVFHPVLGGVALRMGRTIEVVDHFGISEDLLSFATSLPEGARLADGALYSERRLVFRDLAKEEGIAPELRGRLGALGVQAEVVLPVCHHGRVQGVCVLGFGSGDDFTDEDVDLLAAVVDLLALSLDEQDVRGRLLEEVHRRESVEAELRRSEAKYRTLFESAADGIFLMEGDRFVDANPRSAELFGTTREVLRDERPYRLSPKRQPDGRLSSEKALERIEAAHDRPQRFEWRHRRVDGREFDTEVSLTRVDLDGRPHLLAVVRDITSRKIAQRALRLANHRLGAINEFQRAILEARSPQHIAREALKRVAEFVPTDRLAALERREGMSFELLAEEGITVPSISPGSFFEMPERILTRLEQGEPIWVRSLQSGAVPEAFVQLAGAGIVMAVLVPMVTGSGLLGALGLGLREGRTFDASHLELASDAAAQLAIAIEQARLHEKVASYACELEKKVSERTAELAQRVQQVERLNHDMEALLDDLIEANRRLERTSSQLAMANEDLQAFVYSISHDLRAPLRAMRGFSDAVMEDYSDRLDEQGRDYLSRIAKAAQRMDRMLLGLLDYARVSRAAASSHPVNLEEVVHEAMAAVHDELSFRGARVEVATELPEVLGHRETLVNVVGHLLSNAVKFVPKDRVPLVKIRAITKDQDVLLEVEDNGPGILEADRERIFGVFERGSASEDTDGIGIGLAIVKRAVERIGGKVSVSSEVDKGSCFQIILPARPDGGTKSPSLSA